MEKTARARERKERKANRLPVFQTWVGGWVVEYEMLDARDGWVGGWVSCWMLGMGVWVGGWVGGHLLHTDGSDRERGRGCGLRPVYIERVGGWVDGWKFFFLFFLYAPTHPPNP